jgi:hypothetical protein
MPQSRAGQLLRPREPNDLIRARSKQPHFDSRFGLNPVSRQVVHDIIDTMTRGFLLTVLADFDDCYALRLVQEWQRVLNRPPCFTRILPSDHNMVRGERFHCRRYHEKGAPCAWNVSYFLRRFSRFSSKRSVICTAMMGLVGATPAGAPVISHLWETPPLVEATYPGAQNESVFARRRRAADGYCISF